MATVTATIEIKSRGQMSDRLEKKNTKLRLAGALARIWEESIREDATIDDLKGCIEKVISHAVWGY